MDKKGQFFLIAAFVIIGLILSVRSIQNTTFAEEEEILIYDLSDEIAFESYSVIDHGTFNSLTSQETKSNLDDLTGIYAGSNPDSDILAIYGDESSFEVIAHINQPTGEISLKAPGANLDLPVNVKKRGLGSSASLLQGKNGKFIKVLLDKEKNIWKTFRFKKGQNFFIIIGKIKGKDRIIATN
jgi:hypothetical protein